MKRLYIPLNLQRFAATLYISSSVSSQDYNNNTSLVNITVEIKRTSGSTYWASPNYRPLTITCDGQTYTVNTLLPSNKTSVTYNHEFTIQHNPNGTKSISFAGNIPQYSSSLPALSVSGSADLPNIPRGFSGAIGLSVSSVTETSVTYTWSTSEPCDWIRYHFDGSAGWHDVFSGYATSGSFTVYNGDSLYGGGTGTVSIAEGSTHSVYVDARRQDSQQWGTSSAIPFQTVKYPYPVTASSSVIDNGFTVNVSNPLGRQYTLELISSENQTVCASYTGRINGNVTGFNASADINRWYASIPNKPSGSYWVRVTCNEVGTTRTWGNATYTIANNDNTKPTMSVVGYEDINAQTLALTGDDQTLVNGYSTIQVTIPANNKATAKRSATIKKYFLRNGNNQSLEVNESAGNDVVLSVLATSNITEVWAVDSRGLNGVYQIVASDFIDYKPIEKNQDPVAKRTDSHGTPNGVGEYVKLILSGKYWNQSFGSVTNAIQSITYKYANANDPTNLIDGTTSITETTSGENFSIDQLVLGDTPQGFTVSNSYIIQVIVSDKLSSTTFSMTLSSGTPHVAYATNGVSFMGMYNNTLGGIQAFGKRIDNTYSTSEIKVGTWIDGKPIYRKVYVYTNKTITGDDVLTGSLISNLDRICFTYLDMKTYASTGNWQIVPKSHPNNMNWNISYYYSTSSGFKLEAGSSALGTYDIYLTVEYTKTTD